MKDVHINSENKFSIFHLFFRRTTPNICLGKLNISFNSLGSLLQIFEIVLCYNLCYKVTIKEFQKNYYEQFYFVHVGSTH